MIVKFIIGIFMYFIVLAFVCVFFKGATQLSNEFEERNEVEKILKELKEGNNTSD